MTAQIILRTASDPSSSDGNLLSRWENTLNSPIVSATFLGNGQAIAEALELEFTNSGSVTVDVTSLTYPSKSEYQATDVPVVADGATPNIDVIPGWSIVVSASVATGWKARFSCGQYMTSGGVVTDVLAVGIVEAGDVSDTQEIYAVNGGDQIAAQTTIRALPGFFFDGSGLEPALFVKRVRCHPSSSREALAVPDDLAITFQNAAMDGGVRTADVYVDGTLCIATARFDNATEYGYGLDPAYDDLTDLLAGLAITFTDETDDPTTLTVNLHVRSGFAYSQLAPKVGGAPGTWQSSALSLGDIAIAGSGIFYHRFNVPDSAEPGALRMATLRSRTRSI